MKKTKCLKCNENEAPYDPFLGFLVCTSCRLHTRRNEGLPFEFTTESIKQSRKEFADDILQSSRDGVLSRERLEKYGTRGIKVTPEQVKNAEYVWNDRESLSYKKGDPTLI